MLVIIPKLHVPLFPLVLRHPMYWLLMLASKVLHAHEIFGLKRAVWFVPISRFVVCLPLPSPILIPFLDFLFKWM